MTVLAPGLSCVDLKFLGCPHAIATGIIHGAGTLALVDPGPSTCLEALELGLQAQGLRLSEVTHLFLTHIHLDHAGAAGTIVTRHPHVKVLVHQRGAPHLADPAKLLASATRLYGDDMDRLWGDVLPVPANRIVVLSGGECVEAGGRVFEVAYTPGHASHHVSYFDRASGVAFVGDTAGICIDGGYILPYTPPPDIDIELWQESVARIEAWAPQTIFLTHFGSIERPVPHLRTLLEHLERAAEIVRSRLSESVSEEEQVRRFADDVRREMRRHMSEEQVTAYSLTAPPELLWLGLARYWRKKAAS